ncbi:MAG: RHS repeat-associated core domain-containing protein, partial [Bacteroidota bacterium]
FRIYNPSIARFLSVDPLSPEYPMLTPYQFASNTPIQAIDLDGLEAHYYLPSASETGVPEMKIVRTEEIIEYWNYRPGGLSDAPFIPVLQLNPRKEFIDLTEPSRNRQRFIDAINDFYRAKAYNENLFTLSYELTLGPIGDIYHAVDDEEYGQAALIAGFTFLPLRVPSFVGKGLKGQVYFRMSVTKDGVIKPYFGKTHLKGGIYDRYAG